MVSLHLATDLMGFGMATSTTSPLTLVGVMYGVGGLGN
jgi:hypothetical protein